MVKWVHNFHKEPVLIYAEIDHQRYEIRKLEIFRDGKVGYSTKDKQKGNTILSELPLPTIEEINSDLQFISIIISEEEFNNIRKDKVGPI